MTSLRVERRPVGVGRRAPRRCRPSRRDASPRGSGSSSSCGTRGHHEPAGQQRLVDELHGDRHDLRVVVEDRDRVIAVRDRARDLLRLGERRGVRDQPPPLAIRSSGTGDAFAGDDEYVRSLQREHSKIGMPARNATHPSRITSEPGVDGPAFAQLPPLSFAAPADVAQLVEHFTRNEGVAGSSPAVGSGGSPAARGFCRSPGESHSSPRASWGAFGAQSPERPLARRPRTGGAPPPAEADGRPRWKPCPQGTPSSRSAMISASLSMPSATTVAPVSAANEMSARVSARSARSVFDPPRERHVDLDDVGREPEDVPQAREAAPVSSIGDPNAPARAVARGRRRTTRSRRSARAR